MSQSESARVRIDIEDGVADACLDRADKMNALDPAMFAALVAAGERLNRADDLRAVVLRGAGRAFCAGLDFESMEGSASLGDALSARTHGIANLWQQAVLAWRDLPVPVIAAVHGVAFGGGLQIALGADIRCVAHDAKLSVMEINWGIVPDMAGVLLMSELAAADIVRELTYTGRIFSGDDAVRYGLATRAVDDPLGDARSRARDRRQEPRRGPRREATPRRRVSPRRCRGAASRIRRAEASDGQLQPARGGEVPAREARAEVPTALAISERSRGLVPLDGSSGGQRSRKSPA
jgi:enoyl-CoA hydratase/carnithine racemase